MFTCTKKGLKEEVTSFWLTYLNRNNLGENANSGSFDWLFTIVCREISVLIEPREDGPVDMLITYVVGRCLWKPAYDIRLFNSDGSMKVFVLI